MVSYKLASTDLYLTLAVCYDFRVSTITIIVASASSLLFLLPI